MAENSEQQSKVLGGGKARGIIITLAILIATTVAFTYFSLHRAVKKDENEAPQIAPTPPAIISIPGEGKSSREYIQLQKQQNLELAKEALAQKTASIPTITDTTYAGGNVITGAIGAAGCTMDELRRARAAGVLATELRCQGCDGISLKAAGFTAGELKEAGFTAQQLGKAGYSLDQLKDAGFSATDLKNAGFGVEDLKQVGFTAEQLKNAGYDEKNLLAAGFTKDEINFKQKDCNVNILAPAKGRGLTASTAKSCGVAALKAAGFSAQDLKNAGFGVGELKQAGFTAEELKNAGFTTKQLRDGGFSAQSLKEAGFTPQDLLAAGFTDGDLIRAGFSPPKAGDNAEESKAAGPPGANPQILPPSDATDTTTSSLPIAAVADKAARLNQQLAALREQQTRTLSGEERNQKIKETQQNMSTQAGDLFSSWTPLPKQQYTEGVSEQPTAAEAAAQAEAKNAAAAEGTILKAGTILFATLDIAINSDEPSPIMATVIDGKYKGAKVMGNFQRVDKKVTIKFSTLNLPSLDRSITINAYAIDPNTARTVLASSVDSHYLLRYGTLFASSFLEGLGEAVSNSGSTVINNNNGPPQTVYAQMDTQDKVLAALGTVGQNFGQELGSIYKTPPTVKVEAGSPIGLLLMSDLTIPTSNKLAQEDKKEK